MVQLQEVSRGHSTIKKNGKDRTIVVFETKEGELMQQKQKTDKTGYADDCNIYIKSRRAAQRVMESCTRFLEGKLKLTVNKNKSTVGSPLKLKFLGFSMYKIKGKVGIRPHQKSYVKFKNKVKEITSRSRGRAIGQILKELKLFTIGWIAYYKICDMKMKIQQLSEWIRRRIRQYIWKQWKKISARFKNLKMLGTPKRKAWEWANTRKGY